MFTRTSLSNVQVTVFRHVILINIDLVVLYLCFLLDFGIDRECKSNNQDTVYYSSKQFIIRQKYLAINLFSTVFLLVGYVVTICGPLCLKNYVLSIGDDGMMYLTNEK